MGRRRRRSVRRQTFPSYGRPRGFRRPLRLEPLEERRLLAVLTVTTNQDLVDFADGQLSLREAIFVANTYPGLDEIEFDFGHDGPETIVLTQGELAISDALTVTGSGADLLKIDASGNDLTPEEDNGDGSRVFNITDGNTATTIVVTFAGLTITGGDVTGMGGCILSMEPTVLTNVVLRDNAATTSGGGIRQGGGSLVVTGSEIRANRATNAGGGGLSLAGASTVEIVDSTIAENSTRTGGGIDIFSGTGSVSIVRSHIDRNWTTSGGAGGIWRNGSTSLQVVNSTVDNNTSAGRGGGMEVLGNGAFLLEDSSVSGNRANGSSFEIAGGGGIVFDSAATQSGNTLVIRGSRIADNSAKFDGGGLNLFDTSRLEIVDTEIVGNTAERDGGGIFARNSDLLVSESAISGNRSLREQSPYAGPIGEGGGINAGLGSSLEIFRTVVRDNSATGAGGGVYISESPTTGSLLLRESMVLGNTAAANGGGIFLSGGVHALVNSTIAGNTSGGSGGGVAAETQSATASSIEMMQVTISGNRAKLNGGGVNTRTGMKIARSTIADNQADSDGNGSGVGGGIYDISSNAGIAIEQTIIGDNRHFNTSDDWYKSLYSQVKYSLIEKPGGAAGFGVGNITGADPKLGPLAENGGPEFFDGSRMLTHALLPGSPAIDAGDPTGESVALSLAYRAEVAFDLPSAYFRFEQTTGTNFTNEPLGGGAFSGTYNGSPALGIPGAVPGSRAVGLDGVNDYLTTGTVSGFGSANTIEIWARSATELWNANDWIARSNLSSLFAFNPIKDSKAWSAVVHGQVIGTFTPDAAVDIREWHQYALSWDRISGVAKMYFDGEEVASLALMPVPPFVPGTTMTLGRNSGSSSPQFGAGALDEFAVYPRVLSEAELLEHTRIAKIANYDQRGESFARELDGDGVLGARMDIGAVEAPAGETYHLVVSSLEDENDGNYSAGNFSLREAIAVANANAGAATIEFSPALTAGGPATIRLTKGELAIANSMAIHGPGAHLLTIDASGNDPTPNSTLNDGILTNDGDGSRVFNVSDNSAALKHVEIAGLRLTGGDVKLTGGGVLARENLTLRECIVEENISSAEGGGVYSGAESFTANSLTVVDCAVSNNATGHEGGGIRKVIGDLTVDRSVIEGNQAGQVGGGISAANELVQVLIRDSLVQKNKNTGTGQFNGGGIFLFDAVATILNTSVVENEARTGAGIFAIDYTGSTTPGIASTRIVNSTVSGNIGQIASGVYTRGEVEISHSTIVGNSLNTPGANFYSTLLAGTGTSSVSGTFNLVNASATGIVGPLFGSGEHVFIDGSKMRVHALVAGSPAIDAGNPADLAGVGSVPQFDQRGTPYGRVVNGDAVGTARIDIGSYERRPDEVLSFVVDTLEDDNGDDYSPGDRSLREAILLANAIPGVNTITFAPGLTASGPGTILLKHGEMAITEALNIDGPGANLLTVDAQQLSRVFNITATTGNFVIEGLTLAQGKTTGVSNLTGPTPHVASGGAIRSMTTGQLMINDATIRDSATTGTNARGGGVFAVGPVTLNRSVVSGNSTAGNGAYGGGVATQATVTVTDSTVHGNRVLALDEMGGGIWAFSHATITRSTISGNELAAGSTGSPVAAAGGGGLAVQAGIVQVIDSVVRDNVTRGWGGHGGGIRTFNGTVTITRSSITGNQAGGGGGGVFSGLRVEVNDSTISDNTSYWSSGGVWGQQDVIVTNSTVSGNSTTGAIGNGAGIGGNQVTILFSTITNNHASALEARGGGVAGSNVTTIRGSILAGNTAGSGQGDDLWGAGSLFFTLLGSNVGATGTFVAEAPVGSPDARGNLIGGPVNGVIDPKLGPLADNGGPTLPDGSRMLTHALMSSSPALDAGDPAAVVGVSGVPQFDQRGTGFARILDGDGAGGARIDMGAYERQSGETYTFVVDTLADESDGDYSAGDFSLREAIELANANAGADEIEFDPVLWANGPATILLTMLGDTSERGRAALLSTDAITIQGPGAGLLTLDASGVDPTPEEDNGDGGRVLTTYDPSESASLTTVIRGLTFTGGDCGFNGSVNANGGGIRAYFMQLVLQECTVSGNHAEGEGGGVYVLAHGQPGHSLIERCTISSNRAGGGGGGIAALYGQSFGTIVRDSLIADNRAGYRGGGIFGQSSSLYNVPFVLENSTVSGNFAHEGGGVYLGVDASRAIVRHSTITGNTANVLGAAGGVLVGNGEAKLSHVIVAGNQDAAGLASDLGRDVVHFGSPSAFAIDHSLIGVNNDSGYAEAPIGAPDANGNLIGGIDNGIIVPGLGPLVNNGGPTKTHALIQGSPAIDVGDPAAVAGMNGVLEFDQRGMPWGRVAGGRIDMGAVEWQTNPLAGDYNFNGVVDAADYSVWRDTVGSFGDFRADGSSATTPGAPDGVVDEHDYAWWKANFGNVLEQGAGSSEQGIFTQSTAGQASSGGQELAGELRLAGAGESGDVGEGGGAAANFVPLEGSVSESERPARRSSPAVGGARGGRAVGIDAALVAWVARRTAALESSDPHTSFECDSAVEFESLDGTQALDEVFAELQFASLGGDA